MPYFLLQAQSTGSPEVPIINLVADEENLPFERDSIDLFISSLRFVNIENLQTKMEMTCAVCI